jgi:Holliday junction resolvase RusA-like endonuclease
MAGLPPSANHAYFNLPRGGRTLSKEGKGYKTETSAFLIRHHQADIRNIKKNWPYGLAIKLTFKDMYNETWPGKAATRYKKIDVSNRIKLLEDAVVDSLGIDDSQILAVLAVKQVGQPEATHVIIWDYESERLEDVIRQLRSL